MDIHEMTPRRPYIFRAFYDWIVDNELTPYILVDTTLAGVNVPAQFIQDDQIVLNIAPQSVGNYLANDKKIEFDARFGGVSQHIIVPMAALLAIYARENNVGIGFEEESQYETEKRKSEEIQAEPKPTNPFRVVK